MGDMLVGINRFLHKTMLALAVLALGCIVFIGAVFVGDALLPGWESVLSARAPELLPALCVSLALAWAARDYFRVGIKIACNYFPHDAGARLLVVVLFDLAVLCCGAFLLHYGLGRMREGGGTWVSWIGIVPVPLAGGVLVFDSLLLLTGLLPRGEAYASGRMPAYQRRIRRRERARLRKEAAREASGLTDGVQTRRVPVRPAPVLTPLTPKAGPALSARAEAAPARVARSQ